MTDTIERCDWRREADTQVYDTGCDWSFFFAGDKLTSTPGFKYCPFCGKQLNAIEPASCAACGHDKADDDGKASLCADCVERGITMSLPAECQGVDNVVHLVVDKKTL